MYLTSLADICRDAGLEVVEVRGWQRRGHAAMTDVRTVVCHHTAGPARGDMPSLNVIVEGRPDLPGPLAQLGLARSGTVYVVAAGLAYHAGQVRDDSYANAYAIGIEAEATGVDPWPPDQLAAYARLCAALCEHFDLDTDRVLGHKEVCAPVGRKSDPNFSMPDFRRRVRDARADLTGADMPTAAEIYNAVWTSDRMKGPWMTADNPSWAPQSVLIGIYAKQLETDGTVDAVKVEATGAKANAAAAKVEATAAKAEAAAAKAEAAAARAAVARLEAAVTALQRTIAGTVADGVRAALADSTVAVDVSVSGNVVGVPAGRTASVAEVDLVR